MNKVKLVLVFLAILLGIFIFKGIIFGIFLFGLLLKYMVIAGMILGIIYFFAKNDKKDIG